MWWYDKYTHTYIRPNTVDLLDKYSCMHICMYASSVNSRLFSSYLICYSNKIFYVHCLCLYMHLHTYVFNFTVFICCSFFFKSLFLKGSSHCSPLGCWERPSLDRRDPLGPGGRHHRGKGQGKRHTELLIWISQGHNLLYVCMYVHLIW